MRHRRATELLAVRFFSGYTARVVYYSNSEFDVKFEDLLQQVERLCDEHSRDAALANARRALKLFLDRFRRQEKISLLDRQSLANALEQVRRVMGRDTRYFDQIADVEDFIDDNYVEAKK